LLVRAFMAFHWMFLGIKLMCLMGFLIATFWFGNDFFSGYAEFARVASIIFLVLQVLVLVSWAWDVSASVLSKVEDLEKNQTEESNNKCTIGCYQSFLVIATFILNVFCITLWVLMFTWFGSSKGCELNQALISLTIIGVVALNFISLYVEHGSIFVTGIVSCYGSYLCYSGLQSNPDAKCNSYDGKNTLNLWVGILITAAALAYAGFSVSNTANNAISNSKSEPELDKELQVGTVEKEDKEDKEDVGTSNYDDLEEDEEKKKVKNRAVVNN